MQQLQIEQECLKSVSERCQRGVWCTQFSRKTVPHPRPLDSEAAVVVVCSDMWNSQSAGVSGLKTLVLTSACNTSEGTVEPCRADTCRPELLS